jgi:3-methyladenine DNA glycosylase AlkD
MTTETHPVFSNHDLQPLVDEIIVYCEAHSDPALVQKYSRYFKEGYDAWGVTGALMDQHRSLLIQQHGSRLGMTGFLELGDLLIRHPKYECKSYALQFAIGFQKEWTLAELDRFALWFEQGITNWGHTDFFCSEGMPLFYRFGEEFLEKLAGWRNSSSRWNRRAVAVSLIKVMKAGLPVSRVLAFVEPLMMDSERVVHQGLGWLLRECWKKDSSQTEVLLLQWKDRCARLIIQYATEKMTPEGKLRFRKSKG